MVCIIWNWQTGINFKLDVSFSVAVNILIAEKLRGSATTMVRYGQTLQSLNFAVFNLEAITFRVKK